MTVIEELIASKGLSSIGWYKELHHIIDICIEIYNFDTTIFQFCRSSTSHWNNTSVLRATLSHFHFATRKNGISQHTTTKKSTKCVENRPVISLTSNNIKILGTSMF